MGSGRRAAPRFRTLEQEALFWETHSSMDFEGVEVDPETLHPVGVGIDWCKVSEGLSSVEIATSVFVWVQEIEDVSLPRATDVSRRGLPEHWPRYAGAR